VIRCWSGPAAAVATTGVRVRHATLEWTEIETEEAASVVADPRVDGFRLYHGLSGEPLEEHR
jgi:hypothetical protein